MTTEQEIKTAHEIIRRREEVLNEIKHLTDMLQSIDDRYTEILGSDSILNSISGLGMSKNDIVTKRDSFREIKNLIKGKSF